MTNQIVNANIRLLIQFIVLIVQINEIKYIVTGFNASFFALVC